LLACSSPACNDFKMSVKPYAVLTRNMSKHELVIASSLSSLAWNRSLLIEYDKDTQFRIGLSWRVHNTPLLETGSHYDAAIAISNDRCLRRTLSS
jgi:hypothetical protein